MGRTDEGTERPITWRSRLLVRSHLEPRGMHTVDIMWDNFSTCDRGIR